MTRKTVIHLAVTLERFEDSHPSGSPFPAARRVIDTTGEAVEEASSSRPGLRKSPVGQVIPLQFKRVANR